jgi:hypothetical protein
MNAIAEINKHFAAVSDREADRIRLQAIADQALADAAALPATLNELMASALPRPESCSERDAMIDARLDEGLSDEDIIEFGKEWELEGLELVERLEKFCVHARGELMVAA